MAKTDKEEGPRSFARFFENVGDGDFHRDASDGLYDLGNAIQDQALRTESKVKGKMVITIDMSCDARGVVGVNVDVKVAKPKTKRAAAQAWITKAGNVVFENPRQLKMSLREVGKRAEAILDDGSHVEVVLEVPSNNQTAKEV